MDDADDALDYYEVRTFPAATPGGDEPPRLGSLRLNRRHFKAFKRRAQIAAKRKLGTGRYVLFARAYDSANQRSALHSIRFIVTRRWARRRKGSAAQEPTGVWDRSL